MTRNEILELLERNTHTLFTSDLLEKVDAAFGVVIGPKNYQADPSNPKGLRLESGAEYADGISAYDLAIALCEALDLEYASMMGRGFQVRSCVHAIRQAGHDK